MKKMYAKLEADKIAFNYRDQVVAVSGGGIKDRLFDYAGLSMCA